MAALIILGAIVLFLVILKISEGEGTAAMAAYIILQIGLWLLILGVIAILAGVLYFAVGTPSNAPLI